MTRSEPQKEEDIMTTAQATFTNHKVDLPFILKQLRISRSTLGAILEELENGCHSPAAVTALGEACLNVSAEIEQLWEIAKRSG